MASGRPTVRLSDDEIWEMVTRAHTGILTTLKADGTPIALPIWFVAIDRRIYMPTRGKKLARISRNSRSSFLVEDGELWMDLRAVHLTGEARVIDPSPAQRSAFQERFSLKYAPFQNAPSAITQPAEAPGRPRSGAIVEFTPDERILSWHNAKLASG